MRVLLVRPVTQNDRFGLAPFFVIEPLGLEYVAAALERRQHAVRIADLRWGPALRTLLRRFRPDVVGIASTHTLDTNDALATARAVKAENPGCWTLLGGHAAAVYPSPLFRPEVDAICYEDGEQVVPALVDALAHGRPLTEVPGLWVRDGGSDFIKGPASERRIALDAVPLPARHLLRRYQPHYLCVNMKPVSLVETSRGCPFRCSFCSIWQHVERSFRTRSIEHVCRDMAQVGDKVFIADDLFWHPPRHSLELAAELKRRGIRKRWILVQTRTDLVARHPQLLKAWRSISDYFDIFFGFETPTDEGLAALGKDASVQQMLDAIEVCRRLDYGITGNFIVDPDWEQQDFERLWAFKEQHQLHRAGYTILTPLPGTSYYEQMKDRVQETDWSKYDMHHIPWEPRLGRERFFELFAESWKRTVLYAKGVRPWWSHLHTLRPSQVPYFIKLIIRTQRLVDPQAYLREAFLR